jgi:hypothetical protein
MTELLMMMGFAVITWTVFSLGEASRKVDESLWSLVKDREPDDDDDDSV